MKEKKLRIEDALNATKAAVEEGIIIGGGAALVEVYKELRNTLKSKEADVQKGINAVLESLLAPLKQIAENAGYEGDEIVSKQLKAKENVGFNAKTGKWVDMYEAGVVDPAKVARSAILNASSISASVASALPHLRFSLMVPENSTFFCSTMDTLCLIVCIL